MMLATLVGEAYNILKKHLDSNSRPPRGPFDDDQSSDEDDDFYDSDDDYERMSFYMQVHVSRI